MTTYIPFIHEKKKTKTELIPLQIELVDPSILPPQKEEQEEEEKSRVIIIDL